MTAHDPFAAADSLPPLDISRFEKPEAPRPIDRAAAEAAKRAGDEAGFHTRAPAGRRGRPPKERNVKKVKISDVLGAPQSEEDRVQINITSPISLAVRFRALQASLGHDRQWVTLEMALDALEKQRG